MPKVQPGQYKAKIVKWEICPLGKQENLFFLLDFNVVGVIPDGGPIEAATPLENHERRTIRRAMTKDGLDWLLGDLSSLGFTGKKLSRLDPSAPDAHNFSGFEFEAECVHKDRTDEVTNVTKTYEEWRIKRPRKVATKEQKEQTLSVLQEILDAQSGAKEPY